MNFVSFSDVSFTYPPIEGDLDAEGRQIVPSPVFSNFTGAIPQEDDAHLISLIGPNGSGKSTFMLLASGRLDPDSGSCTLFDKELSSLSEDQKNLVASVIYQNMEFETEETVQDLLSYVYQNGALRGKAQAILSEREDLIAEVIQLLELEGVLMHSLTQLSKGEIQRVLIAFSILYGSASVFMDEPMFAMEDRQKDAVLKYLKAFTKKTGTTVVISMHELDLTRKYADRVMLFYPDRTISYGTAKEVMTKEDLEKAYGMPEAMLKHHESMTREQLSQEAELFAGPDAGSTDSSKEDTDSQSE